MARNLHLETANMNNNTKARFKQTTNKSRSLAVASSNPRRTKPGKVGRCGGHKVK